MHFYSRYLMSIVVVLCLSLGSTGAIANESGSEGVHGGEEDHGKHALAVFLGVTHAHDANHGHSVSSIPTASTSPGR